MSYVTTEQVELVRKELSRRDFGHDYLVPDETRLILLLLVQGVSEVDVAATLARHRHLLDKQNQQIIATTGAFRLTQRD